MTTNLRPSLAVGAVLGLGAAALAALIVVAGPLIATGAILGGALALFALSDWRAALALTIITILWLPFGTLPFKIAITPTLLDLSLGAFLLVYLLGWMTGGRYRFFATPVHWSLLAYSLWLIFTFVLGLRHAPPTTTLLRQFAETLLSIAFAMVLVDVLRHTRQLRLFCRIALLGFGVQALLAITLFALPDAFAERQLSRLARIGYPDSGVIRYIEDSPEKGERAIGSWVDPNALGGVMAMGAVLALGGALGNASQRERRAYALATLLLLLALYLTSSRAALLATVGGISALALLRHRHLLLPILLAVLLFGTLPQFADSRERLLQSFQGTESDLATQMRLGEYGDSLTLIARYPLVGIGFSGRPDIDLYADVASLYLIMANQIGLLGLGLFLLFIVAIFVYAWRSRRRNRRENSELAKADELATWQLALHCALFTVMLNGLADHYFFRLDFQASIALFWWLIGSCLAASRLTNSPLPMSRSNTILLRSAE